MAQPIEFARLAVRAYRTGSTVVDGRSDDSGVGWFGFTDRGDGADRASFVDSPPLIELRSGSAPFAQVRFSSLQFASAGELVSQRPIEVRFADVRPR